MYDCMNVGLYDPLKTKTFSFCNTLNLSDLMIPILMLQHFPIINDHVLFNGLVIDSLPNADTLLVVGFDNVSIMIDWIPLFVLQGCIMILLFEF